MTVNSRTGAKRTGAMLGLWRDVRVQRFAFQLFFAAVVIGIGYILVTNLNQELGDRNFEAFPFIGFSGSFPFIELDASFLQQRAGFGIQETSFGSSYNASNSYGDAFIIGLLNTLRVALIGIVLATVLGVIMGIARLSNNWLVSRVAMLYVEVFRNVPLAVQLIFWLTVVVLHLPRIEDAPELGGFAVISNRSVAMPWATTEGGLGIWLLLLVVAVAASIFVRRYRTRREENTGKPSYPGWWAIATFVAIAVGTFYVAGAPLDFDLPTIENRRVIGGLSFTPGFIALLIGLVVYTGTFIAEIVRGGIQAIPKGQSEAAAALGLSTLQRLRLVILPQSMRIIIPPLTNQYLNLTKNSSLAIFVAYPDVFSVGRTSLNQTGQVVPLIILVMLTYLTISLLTSAVMNVVNRRMQIPAQ